MDRYPEGLLKTIAMNLIKKKNGLQESATLRKVASAAGITPDQRRSEFLQEYKMSPDQFQGDREAQQYVDEAQKRVTDQARNFYDERRRMAPRGADLSHLERSEKEIMRKIKERTEGADVQVSINRTRKAALENPTEFTRFQGLSQQSQNALERSHGKEIGGAVGAVAGGALGMLGGRLLPKNTKGLLQQAGGAAAGGAIGGVAGAAIGSNRDEKRTGFNHEDVMKPYEIASRINTQKQYR